MDDFNRENPPSVPELMSFLTERVREEKFAWRPLIRAICNSRAYQLSSATTAKGSTSERLFASQRLKPLTPEQTYDSAAIALDIPGSARGRQQFIQGMAGQSLDEDFSQTWDYRESVQNLMGRLRITPPTSEDSVEKIYQRRIC